MTTTASTASQSGSMSSLRNLRSDNGHTYYFAPPGYCTSVLLVGGVAQIITIPGDSNALTYRGVAFSAQGALFYVNLFRTATGALATNTTGYADIECPAQLVIQNADAQIINGVASGAFPLTFSIIAPVACTVFMRWFT